MNCQASSATRALRQEIPTFPQQGPAHTVFSFREHHPLTMINNSSTKVRPEKKRKISQHTASNSTNFSNNTNSFNNNNVWNNYTVADDRAQLLAWLHP